MKICIMGTPVSSGNRGVLALGASLIDLCSGASQRSEVRLLLGHRDSQPVNFRVNGRWQSIPIVNIRLSPCARPREHFLWVLSMSVIFRLVDLPGVRRQIAASTPWIKALTEADLVGDVHGGDSFSDIYGLSGFLQTFLMDWTVVLVKGTMVQFPQTYGPYKSTLARRLARFLLRRSALVIARDRQSQKIAQDLVGSERSVLLSPDVAFSLQSIRPEHIALDPPLGGPVPGGVIGVNINGLMYHGGYTRNNMFGLKLDYAAFLPRLIDLLLRESSGEIWLVPHTFAPPGHVESDPDASQEVRDTLPPEHRSRVRIVTGEYDQHEIKGVIGQCHFFIGSRMHACIAALSQGVPCVGVAYSMKFAGVFESVGMRDWVVDGREVTDEFAIAKVLELYRRRESVGMTLAGRATQARAELHEVFRKLFSEVRRIGDQ
jgi:colanic acid/amylovoran biosynthesis protein